METNTIKRYSLSQQVANKLEVMIARGRFKVGDKIPTEVELMKSFNVSRNTIREAIKTLVSAGILDVRQGDGTYVKEESRFQANMLKRYQDTSLVEIEEARNLFEIGVAIYACKKRTEEDLEKIYAALVKRNESQEDKKELTELDIDFHMAIVNATHNQIVIELYASLYAYVKEHISKKMVETMLDNSSIDELHNNLYEAIKDQDVDRARSCARAILDI